MNTKPHTPAETIGSALSNSNQGSGHAPRIIRRDEVEAITGLSRSGVYEKVNPESVRYDKTFPKAVRLGERAVGWVESQVFAWVEARIQASQNEPAVKNKKKVRK